ncbi:invasion protein [Hyphomicrobium sulfonivorans]|nr:invasion associated locus B family protein [Hyphomicrobium sulfonivorans]MBI1650661.1 invasion associated locus B family protein [Hyphomicrobium sulfonivorans]NSL71981.1 invasion protein [Hyphomicrobium sulfonivorans]
MTNSVAHLLVKGRSGRGVAAVCAALGLAAMVSAVPALAQDAKKAAPAKAAPAAKAPAKGAAAAGDQKSSAWVKLCEKAPFNTKDKDGKEVKSEKNICLTHHERLDGNTGMVMVSAAIREVEGAPKKSMMVMVPLGMALPPGLRAAVYSKEQWDKAAKNEKIDENALKPISLTYSLCHAAGCTAEIEATPDLIEQMKKGGGIMVIAMNAGAQPIGFPVPLDGFTEAYAGKPIDNEEYAKARGQLMAQIRERQQAALEKYKAEQMKNLPPPPDGAPAAAAAPAAKK